MICPATTTIAICLPHTPQPYSSCIRSTWKGKELVVFTVHQLLPCPPCMVSCWPMQVRSYQIMSSHMAAQSGVYVATGRYAFKVSALQVRQLALYLQGTDASDALLANAAGTRSRCTPCRIYAPVLLYILQHQYAVDACKLCSVPFLPVGFLLPPVLAHAVHRSGCWWTRGPSMLTYACMGSTHTPLLTWVTSPPSLRPCAGRSCQG